MPNYGLTDKSMVLESAFGGWALARRPFAEPGAEPHYAPSRSCEVVLYDLRLRIDPVAGTLAGEARLSLAFHAGPATEVALDLDEVEVEGVSTPEGEAVPFAHGDGKLRFPRQAEVVIRWHGRPRRGLYFVGPSAAEPARDHQAWTQCQDEDAHFIFPCIDHPSVKHPWRIRVEAPPGFVVVSNGRFDGEAWVVDSPMPAYLFTAVVARLDRHRDRAGDVPVDYYVPAGTDARVVRRAFHKTPAMVQFLSGLYGAYPWPRYDQVVVHDFIFGGMENLAATTLVDTVLVDDAAALDSDLDSLVVHELGHQWFGDLVTCQDWSQGWLNEGWATYTEYLWFREDRGEDEASYHLWNCLQHYLEEDGGRYRRPIVSYLFRQPLDVFDRHLYEKGALVIHALRGRLGDEAFWAGVRAYIERHRGGTVHTRHFVRAMEDATGKNLDQFFDEHVFGSGHATLRVDVTHGDGQLKVVVKQTQEGEGTAPVFHLPLAIRYGGTEVTVNLDARERSYQFACASPPAFVSVDPGFRAFAEITLGGSTTLLAGALSADPCVVGRIRAARALAAEASVAALEALTRAVATDKAWMVRAELAGALAGTGQQRAFDALVRALGDGDPRVRRAVVAALAGFRRPEAAAAIVTLAEDPSIHVRGEVARALGRLRSPAAKAACEALLGQASWMEVLRARALEGLGSLREAEVAGTLEAWTQPDRPPRARMAAVAALARLGDEVEAVRARAVERLLVLVSDEHYRVQVAAVSGLGTLRDSRALPVLRQLHAAGGDGRLRRWAYEAMANIRDGRAGESALSGIKREIEGLVEENRKLRDRLNRLEDRK